MVRSLRGLENTLVERQKTNTSLKTVRRKRKSDGKTTRRWTQRRLTSFGRKRKPSQKIKISTSSTHSAAHHRIIALPRDSLFKRLGTPSSSSSYLLGQRQPS